MERLRVLETKAKAWAKKALLGTRALHVAGQLTSAPAVILMYHSVQDQPERCANSIGTSIIHATLVFERQMELIVQGFNPVTLDDILLFLTGEKDLAPRAVAVTFDDGFADNFHVAAPMLSRFGIRASFYLTVGLIGTPDAPWYCRIRHAFATTRKREWHDWEGRVSRLSTPQNLNSAMQIAWGRCAGMPSLAREEAIKTIECELDVEPLASASPLMMNWDEARRLQQEGHIIGSHTMTHPNLAHSDETEVYRELVESKLRLEKELGVPGVHFSYPHPALDPHWNERTVAICKEAGYRTAVTTIGGPVRAGTHPLILTRNRTPRPEHEFLWHVECAFLGRRM